MFTNRHYLTLQSCSTATLCDCTSICSMAVCHFSTVVYHFSTTVCTWLQSTNNYQQLPTTTHALPKIPGFADVLQTYALCYPIPCPPTWWTDGAMHYKRLCIIRGMPYKGFYCILETIGYCVDNMQCLKRQYSELDTRCAWAKSKTNGTSELNAI